MMLNITIYLIITIILKIKKIEKIEIDKFDLGSMRLRFLDKKMFLSFLGLSIFILGYIFFFKFLRLFRDSEYINLRVLIEKIISNIMYYNLGYYQLFIFFICYIVLFRSLRGFILIF